MSVRLRESGGQCNSARNRTGLRATLMVKYDVGVRVRDPHWPPILIKGIDEDFFDQD